MTKHTALTGSKEQLANLDKLATYLESLPEDYEHFDMSNYFSAVDNWVGDEFPPSDDTVTLSSGLVGPEHLNVCGTVACAIGHGPAAGIDPQGMENWAEYSSRVFGCVSVYSVVTSTGGDIYAWAFDDAWAPFDNTAQGAALRIRYALKNGVPTIVYYDTAMELYQENKA